MITYKNITDVEVLNEMPEGATALVNDGGELKQVGCEKMGGSAGGGRVTIREDRNMREIQVSCTFNDLCSMITNNTLECITYIVKQQQEIDVYNFFNANINEDSTSVVISFYDFHNAIRFWAYLYSDESFSVQWNDGGDA